MSHFEHHRVQFLYHVLQNDKKNQLEGKLKDVRFRLSAQRREMEQTNQTRETRIAEITQLQQQLQVHKHKVYASQLFNKIIQHLLKQATIVSNIWKLFVCRSPNNGWGG